MLFDEAVAKTSGHNGKAEGETRSGNLCHQRQRNACDAAKSRTLVNSAQQKMLSVTGAKGKATMERYADQRR